VLAPEENVFRGNYWANVRPAGMAIGNVIGRRYGNPLVSQSTQYISEKTKILPLQIIAKERAAKKYLVSMKQWMF
jgi:hypothetical protein